MLPPWVPREAFREARVAATHLSADGAKERMEKPPRSTGCYSYGAQCLYCSSLPLTASIPPSHIVTYILPGPHHWVKGEWKERGGGRGERLLRTHLLLSNSIPCLVKEEGRRKKN